MLMGITSPLKIFTIHDIVIYHLTICFLVNKRKNMSFLKLFFLKIIIQMFLNFSYVIGIGQGGNDFLNNPPLSNITERRREINVK